MGKMTKAITKFVDDHEREIAVTEFGLIGALTGYVLSDPAISDKVNKWIVDRASKLVKSIHVTIGDGKTIVGGGSGGSSGRTDGKPIGYWEYMDRREQRQHEEHMAEIKMRNQIFDNGESKVE